MSLRENSSPPPQLPVCRRKTNREFLSGPMCHPLGFCPGAKSLSLLRQVHGRELDKQRWRPNSSSVTSCLVTLGLFLNPSEPRFPALCRGRVWPPLLQGFCQRSTQRGATRSAFLAPSSLPGAVPRLQREEVQVQGPVPPFTSCAALGSFLNRLRPRFPRLQWG